MNKVTRAKTTSKNKGVHNDKTKFEMVRPSTTQSICYNFWIILKSSIKDTQFLSKQDSSSTGKSFHRGYSKAEGNSLWKRTNHITFCISDDHTQSYRPNFLEYRSVVVHFVAQGDGRGPPDSPNGHGGWMGFFQNLSSREIMKKPNGLGPDILIAKRAIPQAICISLFPNQSENHCKKVHVGTNKIRENQLKEVPNFESLYLSKFLLRPSASQIIPRAG